MNEDFLSDFTTRYLDPTEVYQRFEARGGILRHRGADHASEQDERLPAPRGAHGGADQPHLTGNLGGTTASQAVILTSRAWGHEGGNDLCASS